MFKSKLDLEMTMGLYHLKHRAKPKVLHLSKMCYSVCRIIKFEDPYTCQLNLTRHTPQQIASKIFKTLFAPRLL